jgi:hypothetical protein
MPHKLISWASSDELVCTVEPIDDRTTLVTAVGLGTCEITASEGGKTQSAVVEVVPVPTFNRTILLGHDFSNGTVAPLAGEGDNVGVVPDPRDPSKYVCRLHYKRLNPGQSYDVNRQFSLPSGIRPTLDFGDELWFAGDLEFGEFHGAENSQRKITYWKGGPTSTLQIWGEKLRVSGGGSIYYNIFNVRHGHRHRIETYYKMNSTVDLYDGVFTIWISGWRVWHNPQARFITGTGRFYVYDVGQQVDDTTANLFDEYRYWTNVAWSLDGRVGPSIT